MIQSRTYSVRTTTLVVLALILVLMGVAIARATQESLPAAGAGFWHTSGTNVLDAGGRRVRIAGVNWYGMETAYWVPAGLDYQPYTKIMDLVKSLGYNTIRFSYSNEMVETNPVVTHHVRANPFFLNAHALSVLDAIASYAHRIGIKIILVNHVSRAERRKHVNYLTEPLWYTQEYPETAWIRDWQALARRYVTNDAIVGFDLRNEPHTDGPGPWSLRAYLNQGATWGSTGAMLSSSTDWRAAAERAGNAVLRINPHVLIVVEGLQLYPDRSLSSGVESYWWGSILTPVKRYPVQLVVPHQVVYSPHDWGPRKYEMAWFKHMSYASMEAVWHHRWSWLLDDPGAPYAAPIWIGEFGTCTDHATCIDQQAPGNQATWFHLLLRYLKDHPQVGWSFFALNGRNANNTIADNGLLAPNWDRPVSENLQSDLHGIQ